MEMRHFGKDESRFPRVFALACARAGARGRVRARVRARARTWNVYLSFHLSLIEKSIDISMGWGGKDAGKDRERCGVKSRHLSKKKSGGNSPASLGIIIDKVSAFLS